MLVLNTLADPQKAFATSNEAVLCSVRSISASVIKKPSSFRCGSKSYFGRSLGPMVESKTPPRRAARQIYASAVSGGAAPQKSRASMVVSIRA